MKHPKQHPLIHRGYSLAELLTVLVIIMILASIAFPSFRETVRQVGLDRQIDEFSRDHRIARSEAVTRGKNVTICKSANATNATPSCGDNTVDWEDGWVVFVNSDRDSPPVIDVGEVVLRVSDTMDALFTLRGTAGLDSFVSYSPMGEVTQPGSMVLCKEGSISYARALYIGTAGRVKKARSNSSNVPVDEDGTAITTCSPP